MTFYDIENFMTRSERSKKILPRHIDLAEIEKLFREGEYQEALAQCELIQNNKEWTLYTLDSRVELIYFKSLSLENLGMYENAYNILTETLKDTETLEDRSLILALLSAQLQTLDRLGRIHEATSVVEKGNELIASLTAEEIIKGASWRASYENLVGNIFWLQGELDHASSHYQASLKISKEIGDAKGTATALNNMGIIHYHKGDLDTALNFYQQSLEIYEAKGMYRDSGSALGNIGVIYFQKGELEKALEFYQRSLNIAEEFHFTFGQAATLTNMGWIFKNKNNHEKSNEYLDRGLVLFDSIGNDIFTAIPLFYLILLALDQHNLPQAKKHLSSLQKLHNRTSNKAIQLKSRLAEALILKQSSRMKNKARAQVILEEIIADEVIEFEYTALAMIHLCELLVVEVASFGDSEVWDEARALLDKLYSKAHEQNSFSLTGESLLLKAKFAVIEGDLPGSYKYYEQAREIATDNLLTQLLRNVDEDQRMFEAEFSKWENLIQRNVSIQQRIEQSRIEEYIIEAQKMVNL